MAAPRTTAELIRRLAEKHRVVMLGGLAVVSHGHSRPTYDADAWLDPTLPEELWCRAVGDLVSFDARLRILSIGNWEVIEQERLSEIITRDGVIRIMGANQPLDIFRAPNELDIREFEAVWARAIPFDDGTRIPDVIDLLVTKQSTGRDKDLMDITFLEAKAEREYLEKLPSANAAQAGEMLERFLTPKVAEAALRHPEESVRHLALRFLRELAGDGDPFAQDILKSLG